MNEMLKLPARSALSLTVLLIGLAAVPHGEAASPQVNTSAAETASDRDAGETAQRRSGAGSESDTDPVDTGESEENQITPDVLTLFESGPVAPFSAYIGDSGNWRMPAAGMMTTSAGGAMTVASTDHRAEGDARRISWKGGEAQYFIQAGGVMDLEHLLDSDAAMVMLLRIDEAPEGSFTIRMDCGFPCGASADLARPFRTIPTGTWFRLAIDLQCFAKEGADFSRIDTPFLLLADKPFVLSVSSIAFVRDAAETATVKCR